MNYDGFRFDGVATAITMVNDKAYGNRDAALVDNTGAVTYSYCHFYASSLAVAGSTDVLWTMGWGRRRERGILRRIRRRRCRRGRDIRRR